MAIKYALTYFALNDLGGYEDKSPSQAIRNQPVAFMAVATGIVLPGATDVLRFLKVPKGAKMLYMNHAVPTAGVSSATGTLGWESAAPTQFSASTNFVTQNTTGLLLTPALLAAQIATTAEDYLSLTLTASGGATASVNVTVMGAWFVP